MLRLEHHLLALTVVAVVAAGCGSSSSDSAPSDGPSGANTLNVGTITGILPYEGFAEDGATVVGYEPDLLREAAKRLGLEPKFQVVEYDALLPGLSTNRFDVAAAGYLDTAEREKSYDAVTITLDRYGFVAKKDTASTLTTLDALCGLTVAVVSGSSQAAAVDEQAKKCTPGSVLTTRTFDAEAQGLLALKSGQVDAVPSNVPLLKQFAKENPAFGVGPVTFNPGPTALFFQKGSDLVAKMQKTLQDMMDDGTYAKILKTWDVEDVAVKEAKLNAASGS